MDRCYSPWGHKESDTTEQQTLSLSHTVDSVGQKSRGAAPEHEVGVLGSTRRWEKILHSVYDLGRQEWP